MAAQHGDFLFELLQAHPEMLVLFNRAPSAPPPGARRAPPQRLFGGEPPPGLARCATTGQRLSLRARLEPDGAAWVRPTSHPLPGCLANEGAGPDGGTPPLLPALTAAGGVLEDVLESDASHGSTDAGEDADADGVGTDVADAPKGGAQAAAQGRTRSPRLLEAHARSWDGSGFPSYVPRAARGASVRSLLLDAPAAAEADSGARVSPPLQLRKVNITLFDEPGDAGAAAGAAAAAAGPYLMPIQGCTPVICQPVKPLAQQQPLPPPPPPPLPQQQELAPRASLGLPGTSSPLRGRDLAFSGDGAAVVLALVPDPRADAGGRDAPDLQRGGALAVPRLGPQKLDASLRNLSMFRSSSRGELPLASRVHLLQAAKQRVSPAPELPDPSSPWLVAATSPRAAELLATSTSDVGPPAAAAEHSAATAARLSEPGRVVSTARQRAAVAEWGPPQWPHARGGQASGDSGGAAVPARFLQELAPCWRPLAPPGASSGMPARGPRWGGGGGGGGGSVPSPLASALRWSDPMQLARVRLEASAAAGGALGRGPGRTVRASALGGVNGISAHGEQWAPPQAPHTTPRSQPQLLPSQQLQPLQQPVLHAAPHQQHDGTTPGFGVSGTAPAPRPAEAAAPGSPSSPVRLRASVDGAPAGGARIGALASPDASPTRAVVVSAGEALAGLNILVNSSRPAAAQASPPTLPSLTPHGLKSTKPGRRHQQRGANQAAGGALWRASGTSIPEGPDTSRSPRRQPDRAADGVPNAAAGDAVNAPEQFLPSIPQGGCGSGARS